MIPIINIPGSHPARSLIFWYLALSCRRETSSKAATDGGKISLIQERLRSMLPLDMGYVPMLDPASVIPTLVSPLDAFELSTVLKSIVSIFHLCEDDPGFAWADATDAERPSCIDAFDLPWRIREEARLLIGHYKPVPWAGVLSPIDDHYVHMSLENPMLVAYTRNANKGEQDLQTTMKPGRYLAQFYPSLAAHTVRDLQSGILRDAELKFAVTADEIENIYVRGPSSCMSHAASHFDGPCHPVRVYGNSDIQLAYVTGKDDHPTARSLVWPEKKYHSRIYGDECLLAHLLGAAGYERHSLKGARIRRIPGDGDDEDNIVLPYLDDANSYDIIDESWLRIGGDHQASTTNGLAYADDEVACDSCSEYVTEVFDVGREQWCDHCRDNDAFCSDFSGDYFSQSIEYEVIVSRKNGVNQRRSWSEGECEEHATFCIGSEEYYKTDAFEFVELKDGRTWVAWYFEEHGSPDMLACSEVVIAADNDNAASVERDAA